MLLGGRILCHGSVSATLSCAVVRPSVRGLLTVAIETSCDDTCVAVLAKRTQDACPAYLSEKGPPAKLFFNEKITSNNKAYGGIHPVASLESHQANLATLVNRALLSLPADALVSKSGIQTQDGLKYKPDFITVTRGPGMRSSLSCGLDTAKGLATAWQVPLVAVHHMQAHALTPRLTNALDFPNNDAGTNRPMFPFLTLLVSGGHTMLVHSKCLVDHQLIASTGDIAIGDALDKVGRKILPEEILRNATDTAYAKHLSKYAFPNPEDFKDWTVARTRTDEINTPMNEYGWCMKVPLTDTRKLAYSFSGLASQAERLFNTKAKNDSLSPEERLTLARTVLGTAFEHLASRTIIALEMLEGHGTGINTLVISGGVAANDFLRHLLREMLDVRGFNHVRLVFPPVQLCTDNAAMIAWTGMEMYEAGYTSDLTCLARRKWSLDSADADGGIIGVGGWKKGQEAF